MELGLSLALGGGYRTVCYVERDAYAAACLVARMEDEALDKAPMWDDLTTFDGKRWCGVVDIVSAGFPCQPFSVAGQRKGRDDQRWIWPEIVRIICEVGPSLVFLENVPGLLGRQGGMEAVSGSLASIGFNAEWGCFRASDVGAPHRRERVFVLAYSNSGMADSLGKFVWQQPGGISGPRWSRQVFPPGPDCSPEDWPQDVPQPAVCRDADGLAHRMDRLRCCGNGVVPQVAAVAWDELSKRISRT